MGREPPRGPLVTLPAMKRIYAKVLVFQLVQLALLWWLQQAFL